MPPLDDVLHQSANIINHLVLRKVQNQLVAADTARPVLTAQHPVRMRLIQAAVPIDHLRLKPETKGKPHGPYFLRQPFDAVRQLLPVRIPVPKRRSVIVTAAKPPVIQDEQLHTGLPGLFRQVQKLFFLKLHIGGFPVID